MTGRTTPTPHRSHGLTVLDGGLLHDDAAPQDELGEILDAAWLAHEIAEAAALCERLEAAGRRVSFELPGNGSRGVDVSVVDLSTHDVVRGLNARDAVSVDRLMQLNGMGG